MLMKESVEKKWSDYAQAAQQDGKASVVPTLLKTTGVLAGVALVPCLSAGTAQAAIITGTNFTVNGSTGVTGAPVVGNGDDFGAFNGQVAWYLVSNIANPIANPSAPASAVIMSYNSSFPAYVLNNAGYAMVMANGAVISSGAGSFTDYRAVPDSGNGYLGIDFDISGDMHYGWIEVSLTGGGDMELVSWGYNDVADASIEAGQIPEPTTMALLACGAAGLVARRRKRKVSA